MGRQSDARSRLLASADRLFRDRGYAAVSVAELCTDAGVNKGSFYHFFPSKRALLMETIDLAWDETGLFQQWERDGAAHRPIGQLRHFLEELFAYHYADRETAGRVRGSLLASLSLEVGTRDAEVGAKLDRLFRREIAAVAALLAAAATRGEAAIGNPAQAAESLVSCLYGLLMLAKVRNDLTPLASNETEILRLAGVSPPH